MKYISIILILCLTYFSSSGQHKVEKKPIVISLNQNFSDSCHSINKPCYKLSIKRRTTSQAVLLLIPVSGTATYVYLYKAEDYQKYKQNTSKLDFATIRKDEKGPLDFQPVTINLTNLDDGDYTAIYTTGTLMGLIEITLSSKKQ